MRPEKVEKLLKQGEGLEVEFKTASFDLNKDTFETICAFLNRNGGDLLLGINNNGKVEGIVESCISDMLNNLITSANNPAKLNPPFYFSPEVLDYEGKKIIHLYIPESSQVHSTCGKIIDRNGDGDLDITRQSALVTNLYLRKQSTYSENQVFPYFELADCNAELFKRVRRLAGNRQSGHPWVTMSDEYIGRSAGLYKKDPISGKSGLTLAAALLLGKDETLLSALPHHRTDAILRVESQDRYDDRDDIRTNLIDSFDRLMAFIAKHLPDKFYLEGVQSISLRDRLFREIVSNLLIHREFANGFPAKLIIGKDQVHTENWSRPHGSGQIDPLNFAPFPKNPTIARFFKEIGLVDELGSGVRNIFKYSPGYVEGVVPQLIEGDIFKAIIPLASKDASPDNWEEVRSKVRSKFGEKFGVKYEEQLKMIFLDPSSSATAMATKMGLSPRAVEKQLAKMKEMGLIERVGPDKGGHWAILL